LKSRAFHKYQLLSGYKIENIIESDKSIFRYIIFELNYILVILLIQHVKN